MPSKAPLCPIIKKGKNTKKKPPEGHHQAPPSYLIIDSLSLWGFRGQFGQNQRGRHLMPFYEHREWDVMLRKFLSRGEVIM